MENNSQDSALNNFLNYINSLPTDELLVRLPFITPILDAFAEIIIPLSFKDPDSEKIKSHVYPLFESLQNNMKYIESATRVLPGLDITMVQSIFGAIVEYFKAFSSPEGHLDFEKLIALMKNENNKCPVRKLVVLLLDNIDTTKITKTKEPILSSDFNNNGLIFNIDGEQFVYPVIDFPPMPIVVCFGINSKVETDQGIINIQDINTNYTIRGNKIKKLIRGVNFTEPIISIKAGCLDLNQPNQDLIVTGSHLIQYKEKWVRAIDLHRLDGVSLSKPNMELVFNILLDKHGVMNVGGLIVETMNPRDMKLLDGKQEENQLSVNKYLMTN